MRTFRLIYERHADSLHWDIFLRGPFCCKRMEAGWGGLYRWQRDYDPPFVAEMSNVDHEGELWPCHRELDRCPNCGAVIQVFAVEPANAPQAAKA